MGRHAGPGGVAIVTPIRLTEGERANLDAQAARYGLPDRSAAVRRAFEVAARYCWACEGTGLRSDGSEGCVQCEGTGLPPAPEALTNVTPCDGGGRKTCGSRVARAPGS